MPVLTSTVPESMKKGCMIVVSEPSVAITVPLFSNVAGIIGCVAGTPGAPSFDLRVAFE